MCLKNALNILQFRVISRTGDHIGHPTLNLHKGSDTDNAGGLSPKYCNNYPQEIGIQLAALSHINRIEMESRHLKPTNKIEFYVGKGDTYDCAEYQPIGFVCMERTELIDVEEPNLRVASLNVVGVGNFVKVRIHRYHGNCDTRFNQVQISNLVFWGQYLAKKDGWSVVSQRPLISAVDALKKLKQIMLLKEEAVKREDYSTANFYKNVETTVKKVGEHIDQLEDAKVEAVKCENFDDAKHLQVQINKNLNQILDIFDYHHLFSPENDKISKELLLAPKLNFSTLSYSSDGTSVRSLQNNAFLHSYETIKEKEFTKYPAHQIKGLQPLKYSDLPPTPGRKTLKYSDLRPVPPITPKNGKTKEKKQSSKRSVVPDESDIEKNTSKGNNRHEYSIIDDVLVPNSTLIISVAIGILDFLSDIVAIESYYKNGHFFWAFFATSLIFLISFMDSFAGYHQIDHIGGKKTLGAFWGFFHFLPAYAAYLCVKSCWNHDAILAEWARADAAKARFKMAMWESMPQLVLQLHVLMVFWSEGKEQIFALGAIQFSCLASVVSLSYTFADFWFKKFAKVSLFPKMKRKIEFLWAMAFLLLSSSTVLLKTTSLVILSSSIREYIFPVFTIMIVIRMILNYQFHVKQDFHSNKKMDLFFEFLKLSTANILHDFLYVKQIKHAGVAMMVHAVEVFLCLLLPVKGVGKGFPGSSEHLFCFVTLCMICFSLEFSLVLFIFNVFYKIELYIPANILEAQYHDSESEKMDDMGQRHFDHSGIGAMWTEKHTKNQIKTGLELIKKARCGEVCELKKFFANKCSGLINSVFGDLALQQAIYSQEEECVKLLLDTKKDLLQIMGVVFYDCCLYGKSKIVKWCIKFLKHGGKKEAAEHRIKFSYFWTDKAEEVLEYKDTDGPFGWTPLQAAARMGHEDVVSSLIEAKIDVHKTTTHGSTALLLAAYYGKSKCVDLLIKAGTDETRHNHGYQNKTAIFWARKKKHKDIVQRLEESNINKKMKKETQTSNTSVCSQDFYNRCLHCKINDGDALENIRCILDSAFKHKRLHELLTFKDAKSGRTPIHAATRCPELLQLLLDYPEADITTEDKSGKNALDWTIEQNQLSSAQVIIETVEEDFDKKHILTRNFRSKTPLQQSKAHGFKDMITLFQTAQVGWSKAFYFYELCTMDKHKKVEQELQKWDHACDYETMTAFLEFRDMDGPLRWTPLHSATRYGRVEVVKVLLKYHADVDAVTKLGSNALFLAAYYGQSKCAEELIKYGSNVATEYKRLNAFEWSKKRRFFGVIKALENADWNKALRKKEVKSPEDFYKICSAGLCKEVSKAIKSRGGSDGEKEKLFDYTSELPLQWKPLHVAARMGHHKIVKLLLDNGAKPEVKTGFKQVDALFLAAYYGQTECVKVLLSFNGNRQVTFRGKTALQWAEEKAHVDVVELLQNIQKKIKNPQENTPVSIKTIHAC